MRRALLIAALLCPAIRAQIVFPLYHSSPHSVFAILQATGGHSLNTTTLAITLDTRGANLILVAFSALTSSCTFTVTDTQSNSYIQVYSSTFFGNGGTLLYGAGAPTNSAALTINLVSTSGPCYFTGAAAGFSGGPATALDLHVDQTISNNSGIGGSTNCPTGTITTPAQPNELMVSSVNVNPPAGNQPAPSNSNTIYADSGSNGAYWAFGMGYKIQTAAVAASDIWSYPTNQPNQCAVALFKAQ